MKSACEHHPRLHPSWRQSSSEALVGRAASDSLSFWMVAVVNIAQQRKVALPRFQPRFPA